MLPHFMQRNSVPHIHFLYQRKDRNNSVLQKYIIENSEKEYENKINNMDAIRNVTAFPAIFMFRTFR